MHEVISIVCITKGQKQLACRDTSSMLITDSLADGECAARLRCRPIFAAFKGHTKDPMYAMCVHLYAYAHMQL